MTQDERITLYALGALEDSERALVEQQLANSAELRAQLAEEKAALQALASAVTPIPPPPSAKTRLLARMSAMPPPATLTSPRRQTQRSAPRVTFASRLRWLLRGLAFAAVAAALALGLRVYNLTNEMTALRISLAAAQASQAAQASAAEKAQSLETDLTATRAQIEQANKDLAQLRSDLAKAQADLTQARTENTQTQQAAQKSAESLEQANLELSILAQPGVRATALPAANKQFVTSTATIFFAPKSNTAIVTVANLPALGPDQEYQVWLIRGDQRVPSSVFNTSGEGIGRLIVQGHDPITSYERLGITIEPKGGSAIPNPDPKALIFLGRLV